MPHAAHARPRRALFFIGLTLLFVMTSCEWAFASSLVFSPATLDYSLAKGASASQPVTLSTADTAHPTATISSSVPWLTVPATTVTLPATMNVTVNATTLVPGRYTAALVASATGYDPTVEIVTVTVTGPVSLQVNFQSDSAPVPAGYLRDFGEAYGPKNAANQGPGGLTYGWVTPGTTNALSLVGNGRDRNRAGIDQRFDTLVHAQGADVPGFSGVATRGAWELAVPNGTYDVTVAVGDQPSNGVYDSVHQAVVEGTVAIDHFQSTKPQEYKQAQVTVTVTDGRLTIDPTGGTNTKFDFVLVATHAAAPPDTTPPAPPSNVVAAPGDNNVQLTWNASLDADLAGYRVFRSTSSPVPTTGTPLSGPNLLTTTSYLDSSATNGTNELYVVQSVDTSGNQATSAVVNAAPHAALTTTVKVNFQDTATTPPAGYVRDSGEPYGPRGGSNQGTGLSYGWVVPGSHTPLDLSTNGRNRNLAPTTAGVADVRLATLLQMQYSGSLGNPAPGSWEIAIPDGSYLVTVTAGDPSYIDSTHTIDVEGQAFISGFKPTTAQTSLTVTRAVSVTGGVLTIDSLGGKNTKLQYVDISPDTDSPRPSIRSTTPADGATNVRRDAAVTADVRLPNTGFGIDAGTLTASTVSLSRVSDGLVVPSTLNTSGGGDAIALQPTGLLDPNTAYRFTVTAGLKDLSGAAFVPTTINFTTGTVGGPGNSSVAFSKVALSTANGQSFTSVTMGPDGLLYAGTLDGKIVRFPINVDGTLGVPQTLTALQDANGGARTITGLAFDPTSTASNLIVWASNGAYAFNNAPDWSGKITKLSGPALATVQDVVVGLPRSVRDHETNQPVFGPDGAVYFAQGASNSGGAPDATWGGRPEHLLTAAVLRLDPTKVTSPPLNVQTEDGGTYNPFATNAPLTIYATGVRNAYDLVWHSNGQLYAPTNGSATGGNIPASPSPLPGRAAARASTPRPAVRTQARPSPGITDTGVAEDDWVHRIIKGGYYGHPNPARCEWVFNGGNPTAGADTHEEPEYPVGVQPDRNWKGATSFDIGAHYSPDGALEYKSNIFGTDLKGKILVVRYSAGDDVEVLTPGGANGDISASQTGIPGLTGLNDPVDIVENPANGNLYVAELGGFDITLLRPGANTGGTATLATDKSRLVYNGVQNAGATAAQTVTIRNNGDGQLNVGGMAVTGTDASQFSIVDLPTLPLQIAPGASLNVQVAFSPTSAGPKKAALHLSSNDPSHPTFDVNLRGLGTLGLGGTSEPSLQWIFDTYDLPVRTGDPDPSTSDLPLAPPNSDEVPLQQFVKAGTGPVTVTPLAVFGPTSNPVVSLGWYPSGTATDLTTLFSVPTASAQSLNPVLTGTTSFDPGGTTFGFWTQWPAFANRLVYQEDALNTFAGALPHQVKVFPMKAADGSTVANQYIVATEESSGDWNDVPVVVSNVMPVPGPPAPPPPASTTCRAPTGSRSPASAPASRTPTRCTTSPPNGSPTRAATR